MGIHYGHTVEAITEEEMGEAEAEEYKVIEAMSKKGLMNDRHSVL